MLRSIGKRSAESVESVQEKNRKATVGRICLCKSSEKLGVYIGW